MIQSVKIISGLVNYGPVPEPDEPVEQRLTISASGRIWFTEYLFGQGVLYKMPIGRKCQMTIPRDAAMLILSRLEEFFVSTQEPLMVLDIGVWKMILSDDNDRKKKLQGSMLGNVIVNGNDMTEVIRNLIPISGLRVFG